MQMRSEIEFTAKEEDACAIIGEAPEAAGGGFQRLDTRVEALGDGAGDGVIEGVEQTAKMELKHAGHLLSGSSLERMTVSYQSSKKRWARRPSGWLQNSTNASLKAQALAVF